MPSKHTSIPSSSSQISVTIVQTSRSSYIAPETPQYPPPVHSPSTWSLQALPPPYPGSPGTPLSFYPNGSTTTISIPPADPTLPEYRSVPRTHAEKLFWLGILFPLIWVGGLLKFWYPEPCVGAGKHAMDEELELGANEEATPTWWTSSNPRESLELWREEERLWAARCAWCLGGFCTISTLMVVVLVCMLRSS